MGRWSVAALALATVIVAAQLPVRADDTFDINGIFAMAAHSDIDSKCVDARRFADMAAKPGTVFDTQSSILGEQAFEACATRDRLAPDPLLVRYLILAAAGAAYMGAMTADPKTALQLYNVADQYATAVGGGGSAIAWDKYYSTGADTSGNVNKAGSTGSAGAVNASGSMGSGNNSSQNSGHWAVERPLFGTIPNDTISKAATAMRASIATEVASLAGQKTTK